MSHGNFLLHDHRREQGTNRKLLLSKGEGSQCATLSLVIAFQHRGVNLNAWNCRFAVELSGAPATLEKRIPINESVHLQRYADGWRPGSPCRQKTSMKSNRITHASQLPAPRIVSRILRWARGARAGLLSERSIDSALSTPRVHVLGMHHVFEDEKRPFHELLDALAATHELAGVSNAFGRLAGGEAITRPILCLTFDDGFAHHVTVGEAIRERGGIGTFFPCTWPLDVSEEERDLFCQRALGRPPIAMMGWKELEVLAGRGHEIGCHTATHRSLSEVPENELADEINGAAEVLRSRLGKMEAFAWPFGRRQHITTAARAMIERAGFEYVLSALGGCHFGPLEVGASICRDMAEPVSGPAMIRRVMALSVSRSR